MKILPFLLIALAMESCSGGPDQPRVKIDTLVSNVRVTADTVPVFTGRPLPNELLEQKQQINLLLITDSVYLENEAFTNETPDGGASLTSYFFNGRLVKLTEWAGLSYGITERNFYFRNDSLFAVDVTEDYFHADSNGTDHSRIDRGFQGSYLFSADQLIDHSTFGDKRFDPVRPEKLSEAAVQLKKAVLQKRGRK